VNSRLYKTMQVRTGETVKRGNPGIAQIRGIVVSIPTSRLPRRLSIAGFRVKIDVFDEPRSAPPPRRLNPWFTNAGEACSTKRRLPL